MTGVPTRLLIRFETATLNPPDNPRFPLNSIISLKDAYEERRLAQMTVPRVTARTLREVMKYHNLNCAQMRRRIKENVGSPPTTVVTTFWERGPTRALNVEEAAVLNVLMERSFREFTVFAPDNNQVLTLEFRGPDSRFTGSPVTITDDGTIVVETSTPKPARTAEGS
ncbi:MAG: hypothetical protein WC864_07465 [Ilumatobacteraceae bacterium]